MSGRRGYTILLAGASIWILLIILQPLCMVHGIQPAGFLLEHFFSPVCHQEAARSLHLAGYPLPVCERCSGIYFSFFVAVLFFPALPARIRSMIAKRGVVLLLLTPVVADYLLNLIGVWENSTLSRVSSGSIAGFALAMLVVPSWIRAFEEILMTYSPIFHHRRRTRDG